MPYLSNPQGPTPVQKAIQTLSLQMPPRMGPQGGGAQGWPYPPEFYGPQAPGGGGGPAGGGMGMAPNPALLEAIRRMLFGNAPMNSMPVPGAVGGAAPLAGAPTMTPAPMGGRFGTQPMPRAPQLPTTPPAGAQGPPDQTLNPSAPPAGGNIDDLILSLFGPR